MNWNKQDKGSWCGQTHSRMKRIDMDTYEMLMNSNLPFLVILLG